MKWAKERENNSKEYSERKKQDGGLAQLGEHLLCKQGVKGSIPLISTSGRHSAAPNPNKVFIG